MHRCGQNYYNTHITLDAHSYIHFFHLFTDKPQFKNRPRNVQADSGSHVSIMCDVDSNPPASIEWTFERTKKASVTIIIFLFLFYCIYTCTYIILHIRLNILFTTSGYNSIYIFFFIYIYITLSKILRRLYWVSFQMYLSNYLNYF